MALVQLYALDADSPAQSPDPNCFPSPILCATPPEKESLRSYTLQQEIENLRNENEKLRQINREMNDKKIQHSKRITALNEDLRNSRKYSYKLSKKLQTEKSTSNVINDGNHRK